MFSKHVSKQLSAYCQGELSAEETRRVAEHLIGCNRCRAEFEEIKLGVKLAEHLPHASAPDSLWADLLSQLDAQSQQRQSGSAEATGGRLNLRLKPGLNLLRPRFVVLAAT